MKHRHNNEEGAYNCCVADGQVKELSAINEEKIRALFKNSIISCESADLLAKTLKQQDEKWLTVYVLYYDGLRMCAEAFILLDKIISLNHLCLFAILCVKHPELELDWNFFEKVRTKRNGVNYYGERLNYEDWKSIEIQIKIYISTLKKEIEKRLE